ncbi:MAG: ion transporter [Betaproteobacteria bacterium]|jgi:voltage-gated potassium channel|nr:ion transporter [Betaproteobacteria bacterium]
MKCTQCQTDNASDSLFCGECGSVLQKTGSSHSNTVPHVPAPSRSPGLRHTVMEILEGSASQPLSRYVEWLITVVVLVNCSAVILDSVPEIHAEHKDFFHELEFWSVMFFTLEYVLRVWSLGAKFSDSAWRGRRGYIFSPFGLVDFFATMPYYMHVFFPTLDLRILRVLRLLRILKLSKYNSALQDLFSAVYSERRAFGSAAFLLLIATIVSASLMHFAEGHAQPEHFGTIPHAIYWAIVTITSGYGNIEPVTKGGEVVALLTGFLGVCMAAIMTGIVASAFANQLSRKKSAYQAQLRQVLADGVVSDAERDTLKRLQAQFRLSDKEVQNMLDQAQGKLKK